MYMICIRQKLIQPTGYDLQLMEKNTINNQNY